MGRWSDPRDDAIPDPKPTSSDSSASIWGTGCQLSGVELESARCELQAIAGRTEGAGTGRLCAEQQDSSCEEHLPKMLPGGYHEGQKVVATQSIGQFPHLVAQAGDAGVVHSPHSEDLLGVAFGGNWANVRPDDVIIDIVPGGYSEGQKVISRQALLHPHEEKLDVQQGEHGFVCGPHRADLHLVRVDFGLSRCWYAQLNWICPDSIPGGFQVGDDVYAVVDIQTSFGTLISAGRKGVVQHKGHRQDLQQVCVKFSDEEGILNVNPETICISCMPASSDAFGEKLRAQGRQAWRPAVHFRCPGEKSGLCMDPWVLRICNEVRALLLMHLMEVDLNVEITINLFGSAVNGFAQKQSDVDIVLLVKEQGHEETSKSHCIKWLREVRTALKSSGIFVPHSLISSARVPVLQLLHKHADRAVDISINHTDGMMNSYLLRTYATWDPRIVGLGLRVKSWAKTREVYGAREGWPSSYDLILLVLFFLQVSDFALPCIGARSGDSDQKGILAQHDWRKGEPENGAFQQAILEQGREDVLKHHRACPTSLDQLWFFFLNFYANTFDWGKEVVSVRLGQRLARDHEAFARLQCSGMPIGMVLDIEDPILPERNLNCHFRSEWHAQEFKKALHFEASQVACSLKKRLQARDRKSVV